MGEKTNQSGLTQILLIIIIIVATILISGSFLYGSGKLDPLIANISHALREGTILESQNEQKSQSLGELLENQNESEIKKAEEEARAKADLEAQQKLEE